MGLRSRRDSAMIWPGFVDAVTTLLMVMMFILTIFTMMQVVLRDEINTQSDQLDSLTEQITQLADALGLERQKAADLTTKVETLDASLSAAKAEGEKQAEEQIASSQANEKLLEAQDQTDLTSTDSTAQTKSASLEEVPIEPAQKKT